MFNKRASIYTLQWQPLCIVSPKRRKEVNVNKIRVERRVSYAESVKRVCEIKETVVGQHEMDV